MTQNARTRRDLEEQGYRTMVTPLLSKEKGDSLDDVMAKYGLQCFHLAKLSGHGTTKENAENPHNVWFDSIARGERVVLEWIYHPSVATEMMLVKLSIT